MEHCLIDKVYMYMPKYWSMKPAVSVSEEKQGEFEYFHEQPKNKTMRLITQGKAHVHCWDW